MTRFSDATNANEGRCAMGIGELKNGRLNLVMVAQHQLSPAEWAQWQRAIAKGSEILYDASQGQLQIGDVFFADDGSGENTADLVLHQSGDPSFNRGRFGAPGAAVHLMPYVKGQVLTLLHELGHHVWNLGEEYSQASTSHVIDASSPALNARTIPIQLSGLSTNQLKNESASALLTINAQIERRKVVANTSTSITVDADFSVLPTDADNTTVRIQRPAECADDAAANFCIMENSRGAGGELAPDGTWTPAADPVTEFCTDSNHDPDGNTDQETRNAKSCWETIVSTPGYTGLTLPNPAAPGPSTGSTPVSFFVLDPDPRFAIVLDRSLSMADGSKLPDAQHGATFWVEFCAVAGDQLCVVWYNHNSDVLLPLREVGTLTPAQRQQLDSDISAITPDGATNIRDALLASLTEISSAPTRAATQVAVLLTDGIHNRPFFSRAQEAVPTLRENGVRVYALGVGDATEVDIPTLDDIASGTGGRSYAVGTGQPNEIETALVEINAEVRGGLIDSIPVDLPDSGTGEACQKLKGHLSPEGERPVWKDVANLLALEPGDDGWRVDLHDPCVWTLRIPVEKGADRCSFTLLHPESSEVWLFLLNPDGMPVDIGDPGHTHVRSAAPHEFSLVADPAPGWWTLVLVRPTAGPAIHCRVVAGVENKRLRTYATARASALLGETVPIEAGSSYGLPLTGLHVTARLTTPGGSQVAFTLTDFDGTGDNTGAYHGAFTATEIGRYRGFVTIEGTAAARTALGLARSLHLEDNVPVDLTSEVPPFRRTVPIQVLVRRKGTEVEEDEREKKFAQPNANIWERPVTLSSYEPKAAQGY